MQRRYNPWSVPPAAPSEQQWSPLTPHTHPADNPSSGPPRDTEAEPAPDRRDHPPRQHAGGAATGLMAPTRSWGPPTRHLDQLAPRPPAHQPAPPDPHPTGAGMPWGAAGELDPRLVSLVRERVDARLDSEIALRQDTKQPPLEPDAERALVGSLLGEALPGAIREWAQRGEPVPDPELDQPLREAVLAEMFGLGRLEYLLAIPDVENIDITGSDPARLTMTDGAVRLGPAAASNDEELVKLLRRIAERRARVERAFNPARPLLNLELPGGQRLAATMGVSARPAVSIRIHRHRMITLGQLVEMGTLSRAQQHFLAAAVRAGKNIVVLGEQKAGKTTLLRGLCGEISATETLATLETEFELGLHHFPRRWPDVLALEERQPNTEQTDGARPTAGISLEQLVWHSLRMHRSRLIFGEVRGKEIVPMLDALSTGGAGAMATLHSRSAHGAVQRMVSLCLGANPAWSVEFAHRLIAESIDLLVHVRLDRLHAGAGADTVGLARYVDEISAIGQGEDGRVAFTRLFRPEATGRFGRRGIPTGHPPPRLEDYLAAGFDPATLRGGDDGGGWHIPATRGVAC